MKNRNVVCAVTGHPRKASRRVLAVALFIGLAASQAWAGLHVDCNSDVMDLEGFKAIAGPNLDREIYGVRARDWQPGTVDQWQRQALACVEAHSNWADSMKDTMRQALSATAEHIKTTIFDWRKDVLRDEAAQQKVSAQGLSQVTHAQEGDVAQLRKKVGELQRQMEGKFTELQPRCPQIVREQSTSVNFDLKSCGGTGGSPTEQQLKCAVPILKDYIDTLERFSKEPVCKERPSAQNCRGIQCPPPQELVDELERNGRLLQALINDAAEVCPQASGESILKYRPQDEKCMQRMPDRTAVGKCANANAIKWVQELRAKAKKLCNVDLRP